MERFSGRKEACSALHCDRSITHAGLSDLLKSRRRRFITIA
jgi:hypothetical protein